MQNQKSTSSSIQQQVYAVANTDCVFCTIAKNENNQFWVLDLDYGSIFLNFNQSFYGRLLYIPFNHYSTLQEIPTEQYVDYCLELQYVTGAIQNGLKADLINIAMFANKVRHIHWHLIPRYKEDERWGEAPWPNQEKKLSVSELEELKNSIRTSLLNS